MIFKFSFQNFSAMSYNQEIVIELLNITLKQGLQYHPLHVQWIRLEGDFEFRMFHLLFQIITFM